MAAVPTAFFKNPAAEGTNDLRYLLDFLHWWKSKQQQCQLSAKFNTSQAVLANHAEVTKATDHHIKDQQYKRNIFILQEFY